jgi:hypothetical protein
MCVLPGANPRPIFGVFIQAEVCMRVCGNSGNRGWQEHLPGLWCV